MKRGKHTGTQNNLAKSDKQEESILERRKMALGMIIFLHFAKHHLSSTESEYKTELWLSDCANIIAMHVKRLTRKHGKTQTLRSSIDSFF